MMCQKKKIGVSDKVRSEHAERRTISPQLKVFVAAAY